MGEILTLGILVQNILLIKIPQGRIRKSDVSIAKNYLNEAEMTNLNEIVTMYLDYAERQARRGNIMYMQDWVSRLDAFLQFNEEDILHDKGKVTAAIAKAFAESEYSKVIQNDQKHSGKHWPMVRKHGQQNVNQSAEDHRCDLSSLFSLLLRKESGNDHNSTQKFRCRSQ